MNCKHCNAELEEGMKFCPDCGTALTEPETEVVETVEAPEVIETPVEETPAVEEKKAGLGAGKIALLVTLAVAAIAVVIALILGGKGGSTPAETTAPTVSAATNPAVAMTVPADGDPDNVTCKGSYAVSDEEIAKLGKEVVATMGDAELTNAELQIYYWMSVYDFLSQYGSYASMFGLDITPPMDRQLSIDGALTWQQYFLDSALDSWTNYQAMCHDANANGYVLEQEYADYLAEMPNTMAEQATQMGYENADEMVKKDMGPGASLDGYMSYLNAYYLGYMYYGDTMEKIAVTDAEIESYLKNLPESTIKASYPVAKWLDMGIRTSLSSDAPATSWATPSDPFINLKSAVTRKAWDGTDTGQEHRIDIETAIRLYTAEAAPFVGFTDVGMLKPGYAADFIILDRDILDIPSDEIDQVKVLETWINGEKVYER